MSCFFKFPELPKEIQEQVWQFASIAIPSAGPRVHRVAPSPTCRYTRESADEVWFTIMPQRSTPVPSLLQACRHSRDVALKAYELWPCGEIDDKYHRRFIRAFVYIHKKYDIFYFGQREGENTGASDYWFLFNLTTNRSLHGASSAISARAKFLDITNDIENWAFDSTIWSTKTSGWNVSAEHIPIWYKTIFRAKSIRVVLGYTPSQDSKLELKHITSGPRRVIIADKVRKELKYDGDKVREVCPSLGIPEFQVITFTQSDDDIYEERTRAWNLTDEALEAEFQEFMGTCDIKANKGWMFDKQKPKAA